MFYYFMVTIFFVSHLIKANQLLNSTNQESYDNLTIDRYYESIPSSFAILINFGADGNIHNMYSSHPHKGRCQSNKQIYDPFIKECRQLYCKDHYQIQNLHCVEEGRQLIHSNDDKRNQSDTEKKFLDSTCSFVNVTLGIRSKPPMTSKWINDNHDKIKMEFSLKFSHFWDINVTRVTNVVVRLEHDDCDLNFLITEYDGYPNDDILGRLTQEVVDGQQSYTIMKHEWEIQTIHTTLPEMNDFCLNKTDMPILYDGDDFVFQTNENETRIYVNKTGRIYYPGEYVGNVLYVEYYDQTEHSVKHSVSTSAIVCEQSLINETCPRILLNSSEYEFENGRQLRATKIAFYFDRYELTDNESVFVCLPHHKGNFKHYWNMLDSKIESIVSTSLMLLSIVLLSLLLITFIRIRSLRTTLNGFNTINLAGCLAIMQITFLLNQFTDQCRISAVMFHFFILATISWSSVIAYDMHKVFVNQSLVTRSNSAKMRVIYGTIAYIIPTILIIIANIGDCFNLSSIKADYGPVFPSNVCWLRKRAAIILYFIVPVTITVLYNFILYLRIICNIRHEINSFSRDFRKVSRIPSSSSTSSTISIISSTGDGNESRLAFRQTSIYTRLSIPLGFTWILALFGTIVPSEYTVIIRIMSYLFIVANTSQGVTLFLAFGIYRKIFSSK
ncbi:hypothetical protein BLOT_015727 [Blomia tropicalis]|nr:hypothetical protein BLOT_015727 [Blomia tropicalis]